MHNYDSLSGRITVTEAGWIEIGRYARIPNWAALLTSSGDFAAVAVAGTPMPHD